MHHKHRVKSLIHVTMLAHLLMVHYYLFMPSVITDRLFQFFRSAVLQLPSGVIWQVYIIG